MKPKAYSYIRFSTPKQEWGDSLRRQSKDIEEIATNKLHLELDDTLHLTDRGLSGYTGDNRTKGALSEFLKLVETNKIAVGSCLIIEHLDRLSREELLETNHLMTGILLKGIDLFTVMDGMHFTKSTFSSADLIISAIKLEQGHEESAKRSVRLRAAWGNKREDARQNKLKMSRGCPMWLELSQDRKKFIPRIEAVSVIKQIFEMKLAGKGAEKIARELNQMNVWKPKKGTKKTPKPSAWNTSTINLILRNNRKLIGELQLHRYTKVNGKRINIPDGEPILNYYPPVIDLELFNQVQKMISDNAKKDGRGGGRGDLANNLFSHMAVCARCGSTMQYLNKGNESRASDQFKCAKAIRGFDCDNTKLHYTDVEDSVLRCCKGLDVANVLPNSENRATELSILQSTLQSKEWELSTYEVALNNTLLSAQKANTDKWRNALEHSFSMLNIKIEKSKKEIKDIQDQITPLENNTQQTEEQLKSIKELIEKMKDMNKEERIKLRLNLRIQLRQLIDSIKVNAEDKEVVIFFHSGQRRLINITTSEIIVDAYPKKIYKKV